MTVDEIERALTSNEGLKERSFEILQAISALISNESDISVAQSLLIRTLEFKPAFSAYTELQDALLRETGLYPYLDAATLTFKDRIAFELHRPFGDFGSDGTVFHQVQAQVYWHLLDGSNVVLSAPTSFGKSLISDAVINASSFEKIVIVVPTIALIDETRKRYSRFSESYKVITHSSQLAPSDGRGAIYILTQERVIDRDDLDEIDFLIIDEFYKLDPSSSDSQRASVLNHAFYKLLKATKQFYLLGPNIHAIPNEFIRQYNVKFIATDFMTVATDVVRVNISDGIKEALVSLAKTITSPTLIYCQSPPSIGRVIKLLLENGVTLVQQEMAEIVSWIAEHYHPDWILAKALLHGIGIHHGRIPRALAQFQVRLFNEGKLKFLICTSTLIEGVNTVAKNVIIYDNKVSLTKFDYFTFKNIQGRSGRMFKHFVGTVFLFHEPPPPSVLDLDFPLFTQTDAATDGLLVQLDTGDLTAGSLNRVQRFSEQDYLSLETIRANAHIDPQQQIELARLLTLKADYYSPILAWNGDPTGQQLYDICELMYDTLLTNLNRECIRTWKQLAYLTNLFRVTGSPSLFIRRRALAENDADDPDVRIDHALDYLRNWATFHLPRALIALEKIQSEVFQKLNLPFGSYTNFAVKLENHMLDPALFALDEYGIPMQIVDKIKGSLNLEHGLDGVLNELRKLNFRKLSLSNFEVEILEELQQTI